MTFPRVLLVDDDSHVLVSLVRMLNSQCKLELVLETSTARALDLLDESRFDLLVSDLRLPGLSGVELLKIASERWPRMRRALFTGAVTDEWPATADAVFMKGSDPAYIAERICELARFQRVET